MSTPIELPAMPEGLSPLPKGAIYFGKGVQVCSLIGGEKISGWYIEDPVLATGAEWAYFVNQPGTHHALMHYAITAEELQRVDERIKARQAIIRRGQAVKAKKDAAKLAAASPFLPRRRLVHLQSLQQQPNTPHEHQDIQWPDHPKRHA